MDTRECLISEEIDEEHEKEQQIMHEKIVERQTTQAEEEYIMADNEVIDLDVDDPDSEDMNSTMNAIGI